jgi:hypothetical protein
MALSDYEREQVIAALDNLDVATRTVVLASLDAFSDWLANVLYAVFLKVKDALGRLWNWLCSQLS